MNSGRERRYPPTPYAPRSPETRTYRDAYDLGWHHYATLRSQVLDHEKNLPPGPYRQGYRDGVIARYMFEERRKAYEVQASRAAHEERRRQMRAQAAGEEPW